MPVTVASSLLKASYFVFKVLRCNEWIEQFTTSLAQHSLQQVNDERSTFSACPYMFINSRESRRLHRQGAGHGEKPPIDNRSNACLALFQHPADIQHQGSNDVRQR